MCIFPVSLIYLKKLETYLLWDGESTIQEDIEVTFRRLHLVVQKMASLL